MNIARRTVLTGAPTVITSISWVSRAIAFEENSGPEIDSEAGSTTLERPELGTGERTDHVGSRGDFGPEGRAPELNESRLHDIERRAVERNDGRGYLGEFGFGYEQDHRGDEREGTKGKLGELKDSQFNSAISVGDFFVCLGFSRGVVLTGFCASTNGRIYGFFGSGIGQPAGQYAIGWTSNANEYLNGDSFAASNGRLGLGLSTNGRSVAIFNGTLGASLTRGVDLGTVNSNARSYENLKSEVQKLMERNYDRLDHDVRDTVAPRQWP